MARTTHEIMADLPAERQARIRARAAEMLAEVEGLQAIRKLANISQAQLAEQLGVRQPTVHRMETQADLYVSSLERFIEGMGGSVDIVVSLPGHAPVRFKRFKDIEPATET